MLRNEYKDGQNPIALKEKQNILIVCGRNKRRSKTAEAIFRNDPGYNFQSAGLSPKSPSQISATKIEWADSIMVMEDSHKARIKDQFRDLDLPPIFVLHIEDDYDYMDPELIEILQDRIPYILNYEM
ncbi:MAG: protein tyrosine phosphatase [Saprospiraceae bacterium]|nr:protein tyrosine phosphatase [Saprospiraceae bacterium]